MFNKNNLDELTRVQLFLSDMMRISIDYTDTLSPSELFYIFKLTNTYLDEKNKEVKMPPIE